MITTLKQKAEQQRRDKIPVARRIRSLVTYCDLRAAFDVVSRRKMIQVLKDTNIPRYMVNVAAQLLRNTGWSLNEGWIETKVGVN